MAKSTDCCVTDGCSNVPMKGSDECCACAYIPEPLPSMDECYGDERSCWVENCFNTPKMFELICDSCVEKHESSDIPGFPSEYEGDDQLGGCGTCNAPTNDWFCKSCYKTQDVIHIAAQEEEEVLTQCKNSCKEMGMMSEGCEFCE